MRKDSLKTDQDNETGNKRPFNASKIEKMKERMSFKYTCLSKDQFSALYQFLVTVKGPFKTTAEVSTLEKMPMDYMYR